MLRLKAVVRHIAHREELTLVYLFTTLVPGVGAPTSLLAGGGDSIVFCLSWYSFTMIEQLTSWHSFFLLAAGRRLANSSPDALSTASTGTSKSLSRTIFGENDLVKVRRNCYVWWRSDNFVADPPLAIYRVLFGKKSSKCDQ
ncbi:hypothetical protein KC324_g51 [Hortaea werneckii]|nr:hypothetical protein KC324_g51 [Hortaea werneckii]